MTSDRCNSIDVREVAKATMVVKIEILLMISPFGVSRTFDASLAHTCDWVAQGTFFGE